MKRQSHMIDGQDLLGIVLTINHMALPLHLLFCSKQGRYNTTKADLLIAMLSRLKTEFHRQGVDITKIPLTMDSWFVSQPLRQRLHDLGFTKIIRVRLFCYDASNLHIRLPLCPVLALVFS